MADKPRTFEEVVAAEEPALRERIERAQTYRDPAVEKDFHAEVNGPVGRCDRCLLIEV
jgi:hypothetical protein